MGGCLGKGGAPLAGSGFGGDGGQALLGAVVGLGQGGVELVRAGGVVAFELVVDLGRRAQGLLQVVGAAQGAGAVHLVHFLHAFGNGEEGGVIVQLLANQLVAEDRGDVLELGHGAVGQAHGLGLFRHVCADVVPLLRNLVFAQVQAIRDLGVFVGVCVGGHGLLPFFRALWLACCRRLAGPTFGGPDGGAARGEEAGSEKQKPAPDIFLSRTGLKVRSSRYHLDSRTRPCTLRNAITFPATDVCPHVADTCSRFGPRFFPHALSGPFDGLRSAEIPAAPTLCKCTTTVTSASTVCGIRLWMALP